MGGSGVAVNAKTAVARRIQALCLERNIAKMLDEPAESVSIRQKLQQLQVQQTKQSHEKERGQER